MILLLYVIAIVLLAANIIFAAAVLCGNPANNEKYMKSWHRHKKAGALKEQIRLASEPFIKISAIEKIELKFIEKSNIRRFLPFMRAKYLILASAAIFVLLLKPLYDLFLFLPTAAIISFIFSLVPFLVLDLMAKYNAEVIRKRLADFISILNRWCKVKEDIFYAFEKSVDSGIGQPLKSFIGNMVIQVRRGLNPEEALDLLQMKADNVQFKDFVLNVKQTIRHRGDVGKLLTNLEEQFYKMEEEYNRRKISTYNDRLLTLFLMFAVLITAYFFITVNPRVEAFYLQSTGGKALLTLFSVLYTCGFYLSLGVGRFKY